MYLRIYSDNVDYNKMNKAELELKINGQRFKAILTHNGEGCFTASIDLSQLPTGTGTLKLKLEDINRKKYEVRDLPVTVTDGGSCEGCTEGDTRPTTCGVGVCESTGIETCTNGIWGGDTCVSESPGIETCTGGLDDDCDGATDCDDKDCAGEPECETAGCEGQDYCVSINSDYSTCNDSSFNATNTIYMKIWSDNVDHTNMKKAEREFKIGGQRFKANLTNNGEGCFTASIDLSEVPTGTGTLKLKLEDENRKKYEVKDLPITVTR